MTRRDQGDSGRQSLLALLPRGGRYRNIHSPTTRPRSSHLPQAAAKNSLRAPSSLFPRCSAGETRDDLVAKIKGVMFGTRGGFYITVREEEAERGSGWSKAEWVLSAKVSTRYGVECPGRGG